MPDHIMCGSGAHLNFDDASTYTTIHLWTDIPHYLPRITRYNGGVPWVLLNHLCLCPMMAEESGDPLVETLLAAHDIHEMIVGDMVSGLKRHCSGYPEIEDIWARHVHQLLNLPFPERGTELYAAVDRFDKRAVVIETYHYAPAIYDFLVGECGLPIPTPYELDCFRDVLRMSDERKLGYLTQLVTRRINEQAVTRTESNP